MAQLTTVPPRRATGTKFAKPSLRTWVGIYCGSGRSAGFGILPLLSNASEVLLEQDRAARAAKEAEATEEPLDTPSEPRALPAPMSNEIVDQPVLQLEHDPAEKADQPKLFADGPKNSMQVADAVPTSTNSLPDPDRFYDLSYIGELRQMVQEILNEEAPLPVRNLAREVSNRHGWQRTGRRIMERVERAMGDAEIHDEFGVPFVWAAGAIRERSPFRGLQGRPIQDVSRTEIASVLDKIGDDLTTSNDQIGDLARYLGVNRVSSSARHYLKDVKNWYDTKDE